MVGVGCLKNLLEVISRMLCLALEITLGGGNNLLVRIIGLLVTITQRFTPRASGWLRVPGMKVGFSEKPLERPEESTLQTIFPSAATVIVFSISKQKVVKIVHSSSELVSRTTSTQ
jgi:hypothetical protein